MMRRIVVLDVFSGPAWRDASDMVGHFPSGAAGGWLVIESGVIRVIGDQPAGTESVRAGGPGDPSFLGRVAYTTGGRDRPTVHTLGPSDADLYEEVLARLGFRLERPEGIELRRDESGVYWGYYI